MNISPNMRDIEYVPSSSPGIQCISPPCEYVPSSSPVIQAISPPCSIPLPSMDFQNSSSIPSPSHGLQTISPVHESSSSHDFQNSNSVEGTSSSHEFHNSSPLHVAPHIHDFRFSRLLNNSPSPHNLQNISPVPVPSSNELENISPNHVPSSHELQSISPVTSPTAFQSISPVYVPQVPSPADYQNVSPPTSNSYHSENLYSAAYQDDISYITLKGYNPLSQSAMSLNLAHSNSISSANIPTAAYVPVYQPNYYDSPDMYGRLNNNILMNKDEGLGSSPSSLDSTSPPIIKEEPFQSLAPPNNGAMHGYFYNDSGVNLTRNMGGALTVYNVPPNQQCVRCGGSSSRHDMWFPDSTGNFLCYYCASQPVTEVPRGITPTSEVERQQRLGQKRRRQTGTMKKTDLRCHNCKTDVTTLWRRTAEGEAVCNSCGLYQRVNHKPRPLSMRKDVIQRRKRKPRSASKKKNIINAALSPMPEINNQETGILEMHHAGPSRASENIIRLPSLNISMTLN